MVRKVVATVVSNVEELNRIITLPQYRKYNSGYVRDYTLENYITTHKQCISFKAINTDSSIIIYEYVDDTVSEVKEWMFIPEYEILPVYEFVEALKELPYE